MILCRVLICVVSIPVAARPKLWVCGHSLSGVAGSKPIGGHGCLSSLSVVCCQVQASASGRSLVQVSPAKFNVSVIVKPR
jgi:hypothetical protein